MLSRSAGPPPRSRPPNLPRALQSHAGGPDSRPERAAGFVTRVLLRGDAVDVHQEGRAVAAGDLNSEGLIEAKGAGREVGGGQVQVRQVEAVKVQPRQVDAGEPTAVAGGRLVPADRDRAE